MFLSHVSVLHTSKHQFRYSFFEYPSWAQGHAQVTTLFALDQHLHRYWSSSSFVSRIPMQPDPEIVSPTLSESNHPGPATPKSDRRASEVPTLPRRTPAPRSDTNLRLITFLELVSLSELSREEPLASAVRRRVEFRVGKVIS